MFGKIIDVTVKTITNCLNIIIKFYNNVPTSFLCRPSPNRFGGNVALARVMKYPRDLLAAEQIHRVHIMSQARLIRKNDVVLFKTKTKKSYK